MRTFVARFRATLPFVAPDDAQRLEIARLELARVATLGIAGADATLSRDAMRESADALDGVRALVAAMPAAGPFAECLTRAAATLRATPDFDAFDRYAFVTRHATPAFQALAALTARAAPASLAASATLRRTWPLAAANVYDARAFDVMAFAPHDAPRPTPALVALGASLFADPRLSGDGARSCASCHVPTRGFSDGRARARAARDDDTTTLRHTPPIRYAAWQPTQFADARAATLEHQIDSVLASRAEMHGTRGAIDGVAARLAESAADRARFAAATGVPADRAVTPRAVRAALAAYLRTLARFDAPFDRAMRDAMRGDTSGAPLPIAARRGFNVFMGRAGCGTCHFAPLFNGTAPPELVRSSPEVVGVASASDDRVLDPDPGRGAIDRLAGHAHAFRTPTVRDAALGGPYMHNGALRTLDDLLDFYDRGGGAGRGVEVPNQTLSARPLRLTAEERADLVAFLRSLVDTTPPLPFTTTPR
ncbi:MAG: hypothetical protein JO180_05845 [Gemmatirosa sp.]|nr:hypothetical protein [Gemmatirosa sp.]